MKKRIFCLALVLLLVLGVTACGAANGSSAGAAAEPAAAPAEAAGGSAYDMAAMEEAGYDTAESLAESDGMAAGLSQGENRKLIYTGNLTLYTARFDEAVRTLSALVEESGGYFESREVYQYNDDTRSAYYTVRIPSEGYDAFLASVEEDQMCKLVYQTTSVEDVSEAYYDLENRLETQQTMLTRLNELLSQAESMEDILTIQSQITEVEYQIERLTGERNHYDSLIDYSTVYISLDEVSEAVEEMEPGFGQRLVSGFQDGWKSFVAGMQALAVFLARNCIALVLVAVIAAAVVIAVRRSRKKRREKQRMKAQSGREPEEK